MREFSMLPFGTLIREAGCLLVIALTVGICPTSLAKGIDCAHTEPVAVKLICSTPELSKLNTETAAAYRKDLAEANDEQRSALITLEKFWTKEIRNQCDDVQCLERAYWARLVGLKVYGVVLGSNSSPSFNCAQASSRVEKTICADPVISKLDAELGLAYWEDMGHADARQKDRLVREQKRWLTYTRNVCRTETCFKHAYWSRVAELTDFYRPHFHRYKHAEENALSIQQILSRLPLYHSTQSDPRLCNQIIASLKEMKGVHFVDPVVQVGSYENPELLPWRRRWAKDCGRSYPYGAPITFDEECPGNWPYGFDFKAPKKAMESCDVFYGVPPFKVFQLPPRGSDKEERVIFYEGGTYGPTNSEVTPPVDGRGGRFFQAFPGCGKDGGWASAAPDVNDASNYDSVIEFRNRYFFLMLTGHDNSYFMAINSASNRREICRWSSVKINASNLSEK